jgi:L-rhamnose isomerase
VRLTTNYDASINHIAAWTIGTHNALRLLLMALLVMAYREVPGRVTTFWNEIYCRYKNIRS